MAVTWQTFSKEISQMVADAGKSIVAVDGRSGHTSSGIVWRAEQQTNDTEVKPCL